jgi:23S rRNA (adenine-N6)-dimethyltransferase
VANPPFAVTTALVRRLLQPGSRLVTAHLVVPAHAATRWVGPTAPARQRWSRDFDVVLGARVPRQAFRPPPPVDARVLVIRRR